MKRLTSLLAALLAVALLITTYPTVVQSQNRRSDDKDSMRWEVLRPVVRGTRIAECPGGQVGTQPTSFCQPSPSACSKIRFVSVCATAG
jgi:hypothetical protein